MKSLCVCALLLLGSASAAQAQVETGKPLFATDNAAPDFSATSAAKATLPNFLAVADSFARPGALSAPAFSAPRLRTALLAESAPADPARPSPEPRFVYGGRDDYRWQLGLSLAVFHFQSSVFSSTAVGVEASVAYFLNEWLGVEGSVTGAIGGTVYAQGGRAKFALFGGGPKIAWRQKRWEPWLHAIFGGAHEQPQTAAGSRNTYSIMPGGGADYRWNPHLSFRLEGDYVRTAFFHQSQNNFQVSGGAVLHF